MRLTLISRKRITEIIPSKFGIIVFVAKLSSRKRTGMGILQSGSLSASPQAIAVGALNHASLAVKRRTSFMGIPECSEMISAVRLRVSIRLSLMLFSRSAEPPANEYIRRLGRVGR